MPHLPEWEMRHLRREGRRPPAESTLNRLLPENRDERRSQPGNPAGICSSDIGLLTRFRIGKEE